jgi:hypothetical protein
VRNDTAKTNITLKMIIRKPEGRDHSEDIAIDGSIILK